MIRLWVMVTRDNEEDSMAYGSSPMIIIVVMMGFVSLIMVHGAYSNLSTDLSIADPTRRACPLIPRIINNN